jgi:hypothetical protein
MELVNPGEPEWIADHQVVGLRRLPVTFSKSSPAT